MILKKILSRDNLYPPPEIYKYLAKEEIYKKWKCFLEKNTSHTVWIYIHIPFCKTKCSFCHCRSFVTTKHNIDTYIEYLKSEISSFSSLFSKTKIHNIYFWWGTPSILSELQLESLFAFLYENFDFIKDVPFCFEAMPETLTKEKIDILAKYGVTRLSLWVQSINSSVLKNINRVQELDNLSKIYDYAKKYIKFINLDLVCWLEWETLDTFKEGLEYILSLNPDIIHIYRFTPSETTLFNISWKVYSQVAKKMREDMYQYAVKRIYESGRVKLKNDDYWFNLDARNISIVERIENASSNLWMGYSARSNIFWELSYINSWFIDNDVSHFREIDSYIAYEYDMNEEKNRYVMQNLLDGLSLTNYKSLFWTDFLEDYSWKLKYLIDKYWKESIIFSNNDVKINFDLVSNLIFNTVFYSKEIINNIKELYEVWFE